MRKLRRWLTAPFRWLGRFLDEPAEVAWFMTFAGLAVAVAGYWYLHVYPHDEQSHLHYLVYDFYGNTAVTLVFIGVTVLLIDRLYEQRAKLEEKDRIIRQMASPSNEFAKEAARLVEENGWLRDGSLAGVNLRFANLQGVVLKFANLQAVNLESANLKRGQLQGTNLQGAYLEGADLKGAFLAEVNLERAKLGWADLQGTELPDANLQGANLRSANLQGAYLGRANLQGADLRSANLQGAYLDADLKEANLRKAKYDNDTTWPVDFDPQQAGAVFDAST